MNSAATFADAGIKRRRYLDDHGESLEELQAHAVAVGAAAVLRKGVEMIAQVKMRSAATSIVALDQEVNATRGCETTLACCHLSRTACARNVWMPSRTWGKRNGKQGNV